MDPRSSTLEMAPEESRISRASGKLLWTVLLAASVAAQAVQATPPINDDFANRIQITGTRVTVTSSNHDATVEPGEPTGATANDFPVLKTVWWTWTALEDGGIVVNATSRDFDPVPKVYTGSVLSNLVLVPSESWSPSYGRRHTTMRVTAGSTYQIAVGSWTAQAGGIILDLGFVPRASNDSFANPIALGGQEAQATSSTLGATVESDEPLAQFSQANGTLWWSWTAATSGPVIFQAVAAQPSADERVFGGNLGSIALIVCTGESLEGTTLVAYGSRWNELAPPLSQVIVDAVAGMTYHVSVYGELGYLGRFTLTVAKTSSPEIAIAEPRNESEFVVGTPVRLAAEALDPDGVVTGVEFFARTWPEWNEAESTANARPFRGVLTNLAPAKYILVARASDNSGIKSDSIPIEFDVRPANDAFANHVAITGSFVTVTGALANASAEPGEPPDQRSIWWEWTPPASGTYTLTATTEFGPASVGVFTGSSLETLLPVPNPEPGSGRAVIHASAGTSHKIAVSGYGFEHNCTLQVAQTAPPGVTLISPTNHTRIIEGNPVVFSVEAADPDGNISQVEYFDESGSSLGAASVAPFTLSRPMPRGYYFVRAAATDNLGVTTWSEQRTFQVVPVPPANDDFANRIPFAGSFVTVTGDTANTTFETGEIGPGHGGSAWWEWTATESGDYSVTITSNRGNWPWLAIYTGTAVENLTVVTNTPFYGFDPSGSTLVTMHAVAGERYQVAVVSGATVRIDVARNLPPTVRISNPTNDSVFLVGQTVELRAEASDPDGSISRIEFYQDGWFLAATLTNEPFVLAVPFTSESYHSFLARAVDNHGVGVVSEALWFLVRNPGPTNDAFADRIHFTGSSISVTGSAANATLEYGELPQWVEGRSAWWAWTAPAAGTFTIDVHSDQGNWPLLAVLAGTQMPGLTLITNAAYDGGTPDYSVQVVVEVEAGVTYPIAIAANGPVTLTVAQTTPPSVVLLEPASGSTFRMGDPVTLTADASDADGSIRSVEFFLDGRQFALLTNAPFTLQTSFFDANVGHSLRARATDDKGISTFSEPVQVEVRFHPPANDLFASRAPLHGWFTAFDALDWEATLEPGEPTLDGGLGSIWWSWTAPASGRVILTCDRSYAYLAVCRGTNVADLTVVAAAGPSISTGLQVEFDAIAGVEYAIAFQSLGNDSGDFRMSLLLGARELFGPRWVAPDRFAFDLRTTFERTWIIEATTNLMDWLPVATNRLTGGTFEFLDPTASGHPLRFYRAVADW